MRAWYQKDMTTGLLYICSLGEAQQPGSPDAPHLPSQPQISAFLKLTSMTWTVPYCI